MHGWESYDFKSEAAIAINFGYNLMAEGWLAVVSCFPLGHSDFDSLTSGWALSQLRILRVFYNECAHCTSVLE